jgi:SHS family lactate transporter-like MFS transporter
LQWNLVCERQGLGELTQTLVTVGQAIGASVFPFVSDRYGRKPVIVSTHLVATAAAIAMSFAPNYIMYSLLRLIFGVFQQVM